MVSRDAGVAWAQLGSSSALPVVKWAGTSQVTHSRGWQFMLAAGWVLPGAVDECEKQFASPLCGFLLHSGWVPRRSVPGRAKQKLGIL